DRPPHPYGGIGWASGRVWRGNPADPGHAAGPRLWARVRGKEPAPDGQIRRHVPRRANCRDSVATIELVASRPATGAERPAPAGLLLADGQRRTLERADAARAHRLNVV